MKNKNLIFIIVLAIGLGACCKGKKDDVTIYIEEKYKDWLVDNNNLTCIFKEVNSGMLDTIVYNTSYNSFDCKKENNGSWLNACYRNKCIEATIIQKIAKHPKKIEYYVYEIITTGNSKNMEILNGNSIREDYRDGGGVSLKKTINGSEYQGTQYQRQTTNSTNMIDVFVVTKKGVAQYQYNDSIGKKMTWERIN